ncbi:agmatine deiminase family protein [Kitasatospora sp. CB01950]|uniref:agmatine deiminase family protein n=1 Tax=Kitasatospora sp. CB01950 TaxID=1703930 RepID=UPI0009F9639F|nr:agmatine deiminase family protein [Kitasatospora sp. CB01950]
MAEHPGERTFADRLLEAFPPLRWALGAPEPDEAGPTPNTSSSADTGPSHAYPHPHRRWVPAEHEPHARTWMSWPSRKSVWGRQLAGVQQDIALIAATVAEFEPVVMCAPDGYSARQVRDRCGSAVEVTTAVPTDDLWMRDIAPVFRRDGAGGLDAVGLGFNGWGRKQVHADDARVAEEVARRCGVPFERAGFVGEGGAVEADGDGTVIATESSLVNRNRNPGLGREEVEAAVLSAYGARKMIWLPGIRGKDITDDHVDVTSRFVRPGVVMVQLPPPDRDDVWARGAREQFALLSAATDARGRRLQVIRVDGPDTVRSRSAAFVDSYLNFHLVNGGVITAEFGDRVKDEAARRTLAAAFPGREVVQLDVDRLMAGGGGIHCSTMHEPLA